MKIKKRQHQQLSGCRSSLNSAIYFDLIIRPPVAAVDDDDATHHILSDDDDDDDDDKTNELFMGRRSATAAAATVLYQLHHMASIVGLHAVNIRRHMVELNRRTSNSRPSESSMSGAHGQSGWKRVQSTHNASYWCVQQQWCWCWWWSASRQLENKLPPQHKIVSLWIFN